LRHIVLITTSYPMTSDGSEAAGSFVVDFAHALAEKVRVTVVAPGFQTDDEHVGNLMIRRYQAPRQPLSLLKAYNPLHWIAILKTLHNGKKRINQLVEKEKVDHILALWVLPSGFWAKKVAEKHHIRYSTWALGSDIWSLGRIPLVKTILKNVLRESHYNFADGFQLKDDVEKISGRECIFLPSTRNLNIPKEKILSTKPPYKLAFLGRWHHNKGVDLLMDSLALLHASDWQRIKEVRICGGGPMDVQVKEDVVALKKQGHPVVLRGYLNKEEAVELLLWADYVLIPSRIESIPVIFSDAMKCRCPVVSMPVGDLPRLVKHSQVGIMAGDVTGQCFADAISKILRFAPVIFTDGLDQASLYFNVDIITETVLLQFYR